MRAEGSGITDNCDAAAAVTVSHVAQYLTPGGAAREVSSGPGEAGAWLEPPQTIQGSLLSAPTEGEAETEFGD